MTKMSFSVMWNLHNHTTSSDCSFSFVRPCLPSAQLQAELGCQLRLLTGFGTTTDQINQQNLPKKTENVFFQGGIKVQFEMNNEAEARPFSCSLPLEGGFSLTPTCF